MIQAPYNLKSFNRYAYVWNNPLTMFDPTGYNADSMVSIPNYSFNFEFKQHEYFDQAAQLSIPNWNYGISIGGSERLTLNNSMVTFNQSNISINSDASWITIPSITIGNYGPGIQLAANDGQGFNLGLSVVSNGSSNQPPQLGLQVRMSDQEEANRVASEVSRRGGFNGKGEADWLLQLNSDKTLTVTVDASKLTVQRTSSWSSDKNGGNRASAEMVDIDQFMIYGHGTVRERPDGTFGYYDKRYHYDMHNDFSFRSLKRNLLTFFSEPPQGNFSNTPFIIRYEGNINLVNPGEAK